MNHAAKGDEAMRRKAKGEEAMRRKAKGEEAKRHISLENVAYSKKK